MKTLSRKPFLLMLRDDSGELTEVKLDPALVTSDNALIVLDEYNDTCWVWIGKNVNMPTRMHTLRMARSIQKSGHKVGVTTIGMATSRLVEMMEKDSSDPEVAANIEQFKDLLASDWKFEDEVLAYDEALASHYEAAPPRVRDTAVSPPPRLAEFQTPRPTPPPRPTPREVAPPTPPEPRSGPRTTTNAAPAGGLSEHKAAYLLYSAVKNADLVYTERFERDGKTGIKIEAPGIMIIEAVMDGDELRISPPEFGDSEAAKKIKADYETWAQRL
ncbi:MAG: hypothetical protein ACTSPE_11990 [Candidatus Thorarchaeota archaeon]